MSTILRFPVPAEVLENDKATYADTPVEYLVDVDPMIPGGCMISGTYAWHGESRLAHNVSARRLVCMLLERIAELEKR